MEHNRTFGKKLVTITPKGARVFSVASDHFLDVVLI
jgi:hypothetical protein